MTLPAAPPGLFDPVTQPLPAAVPIPDGSVRRAVPYAVRPGFRPLQIDLYQPAAGGPRPVVLFLHGGGWRLGSRGVFCPTWRDWQPDPFARIVAAGFVVASAEYRLSGEADASGAVRAQICCQGEMVRLQGRLRYVDLRPTDSLATLVAELYDGTEGVQLIWLGRRSIPGISRALGEQ